MLKVFWYNIFYNEEMWGHAQEKPVAIQIKQQK
jgi:hypothetical protein